MSLGASLAEDLSSSIGRTCDVQKRPHLSLTPARANSVRSQGIEISHFRTAEPVSTSAEGVLGKSYGISFSAAETAKRVRSHQVPVGSLRQRWRATLMTMSPNLPSCRNWSFESPLFFTTPTIQRVSPLAPDQPVIAKPPLLKNTKKGGAQQNGQQSVQQKRKTRLFRRVFNRFLF